MPEKEEARENHKQATADGKNKASQGTSISHLNPSSPCSHLWLHPVYSQPPAKGISKHLHQIISHLSTESCHGSHPPQVQILTGSHSLGLMCSGKQYQCRGP